MPSIPLVVAVAAGALLAVVVGVDVAINRVHYLEVETDEGWVTLAREPFDRTGSHSSTPFPARTTFDANESDTLRFRIRVDNGYPWAMSEPFEVRIDGRLVGSGTLEVPARSHGEAIVEVEASRVLVSPQPGPVRDSGPDAYHHFYVQADVGGTILAAGHSIREVSA